MYPFNYVTITERVYLDEDGRHQNLFGLGTIVLLGGEIEEPKEYKRVLFSGWVNNEADIMRMSRAYNVSYYNGTLRNLYRTTTQYRKEMEQLELEDI